MFFGYVNINNFKLDYFKLVDLEKKSMKIIMKLHLLMTEITPQP